MGLATGGRGGGGRKQRSKGARGGAKPSSAPLGPAGSGRARGGGGAAAGVAGARTQRQDQPAATAARPSAGAAAGGNDARGRADARASKRSRLIKSLAPSLPLNACICRCFPGLSGTKSGAAGRGGHEGAPAAAVERFAEGLGFSPSQTISMNKHEERRCAACKDMLDSYQVAAVRAFALFVKLDLLTF